MNQTRDGEGRSGRAFVVTAVVMATAFVAFLLLVTPALQDQLGIGPDGVPLATPGTPVRLPLAGGATWEGTVVWDASGLCAEVRAAGTTTRSCASADPLRPLWGIQPVAADPPLVVVAAAPDVASVEVETVDGQRLSAQVQGPDEGLPGGFAVLAVPAGAQVAALLALDAAGGELVRAPCGTGGSGAALLGGGCTVPAE